MKRVVVAVLAAVASCAAAPSSFAIPPVSGECVVRVDNVGADLVRATYLSRACGPWAPLWFSTTAQVAAAPARDRGAFYARVSGSPGAHLVLARVGNVGQGGTWVTLPPRIARDQAAAARFDVDAADATVDQVVDGSGGAVDGGSILLSTTEDSTLEVRMSGGAYLPATNGFQAHHVVLSHDYFRISRRHAIQLAAGIRAWLAAPHSSTVFSVPGGTMGFAATGSAWDPAVDQVVVFQLYQWTPAPTTAGEGHHHGGNYFALGADDLAAMADVLEVWSAKPYMSESPIYQRSAF